MQSNANVWKRFGVCVGTGQRIPKGTQTATPSHCHTEAGHSQWTVTLATGASSSVEMLKSIKQEQEQKKENWPHVAWRLSNADVWVCDYSTCTSHVLSAWEKVFPVNLWTQSIKKRGDEWYFSRVLLFLVFLLMPSFIFNFKIMCSS